MVGRSTYVSGFLWWQADGLYVAVGRSHSYVECEAELKWSVSKNTQENRVKAVAFCMQISIYSSR